MSCRLCTQRLVALVGKPSPKRKRRASAMRPSSQNLQRNGSDAGNQERLVRRVDVAQLLTACQRFAVHARGVEIRAMKQTSAPRSCIAATFEGLAVSGTTMIARASKSLAGHAMD